MPWIPFFFSEVSGYQLQQIDSIEIKLLWLIPLTGFISLVAAIAKKSVCVASQLAGIMPFVALLYYGLKIGHELFNALRPGAYLTLFLGAVLFIAPRFLKTAKP